MKINAIANHPAWVSQTFLLGTPVAAIALTGYYVATQPFHPLIWIFGLIYYYATGMSITCGYHRLYSHCAYEASKPVKWMYALFGAAAFQHSILKWSMDHRLHHRHVDTDMDPYSISKGFYFAHIGWMLEDQTYPDNAISFTRDLQNDPIVIFQHRYYILVASIMCFGFPTLIGWMLGSALGGLAVGGFLRLVLVHHATFLINSWCHTFGRKPYTNEHSGKDNVVMAFFTFGEGYHNFHHTFANDYRNGIRWYQWDPTKWVIRLLATVQLVKNLRVTPETEILAARLTMDESKIKERWSQRLEAHFHRDEIVAAVEQRVAQLKARVSEAQLKWAQLKKEYHQLKESYTEASRAKLLQLRAEMKLAKIEFQASWKQWRAYHSFLLVASPVAI